MNEYPRYCPNDGIELVPVKQQDLKGKKTGEICWVCYTCDYAEDERGECC